MATVNSLSDAKDALNRNARSRPPRSENKSPLKLCLFHLHGLFRGKDLELGRDADTGGQTLYVLEMAKSLVEVDPNVEVTIVTRQIFDPTVSDDYAIGREVVCPRVQIVRLPFGPEQYLAKEELWEHLPELLEETKQHFATHGIPDVIHGHYADAGMVGGKVARYFDLPFVFTGHSLGRCKRRRLADSMSDTEMEQRFCFSKRIAAEEYALRRADLTVTSTQQEIDEQYALYERAKPQQMQVIPPGVDLERFRQCPLVGNEDPIARQIERFLRDPQKPTILAMSRPDTRKNIATLLDVYGGSKRLQQAANLVLILGTRDDLRQLPEGCYEVMNEVLHQIDQYDLYGRVAYPKEHTAEQVPQIYRYAQQREGVFVNIALTEPFGLTILEAGAAGLPVVATCNGGPTEILSNTDHGVCVPPDEPAAIEDALFKLLTNGARWQECHRSGVSKVREHYSWQRHARDYLRTVRQMIMARSEQTGPHADTAPFTRSPVAQELEAREMARSS